MLCSGHRPRAPVALHPRARTLELVHRKRVVEMGELQMAAAATGVMVPAAAMHLRISPRRVARTRRWRMPQKQARQPRGKLT